MKRNKLILPLAAFTLLFSLGLAACNNGGEDGEPASQQSGEEVKITVTAADNKKNLILGDTVQLTASVNGVTWSSSKPEVAEVSAGGLVTSKGVGTTVIKASKDGCKDGQITIKVDLETIKITAEGGKTTLVMEDEVKLTADQAGVTWSSSNPSIASVDDNGKVTAVYAGSATIKANKTGFNEGKIDITVTRPAALKTLHFEDADHYSADGWWGTADEGFEPIYARSSGNASDQQCIAHFGQGDKETLTFTSDADLTAELVMTMASSSEISDVGAVMSVKFNGTAISLTGKSFTGGSSSQFDEFSLGNVEIKKNQDNVLELEFLADSGTPYIDDLSIYGKGTVNIQVKQAPARERVSVLLPPEANALAAYIDTEIQINLVKPTSTDGVTYSSDKEDIASVDTNGVVTGHKLGTASITVKKDGWYSARVEVVVDKAGLKDEIRVQAEDIDPVPDGFHKYTDKTQGIENGHYGSAYITGYDVSTETTLTYLFNSPKAQTMRLIIAGAPHYKMQEGDFFSFVDDCELKLNDAKITVNAGAQINGPGGMGAATVEITIGDVNVKEGENKFEIVLTEKGIALDAFRFIPLTSLTA